MLEHDWYKSPLAWEGVANEDLNRLLTYIVLTQRAGAYARKVARGHSYPNPSSDFVEKVRGWAATNAKRKYLAAAPGGTALFGDEADVVRKGNGFLRYAFLQARHNEVSVATEPTEPEVLDVRIDDPRDAEVDDGDSASAAVAGVVARLRSAVTLLVDARMLTCVHDGEESAPACHHRCGTCPDMPVVLSVALQIMASWERAWPPLEGLSVMQPVWEPPKLAKYAMLAVADPVHFTARPDHVPPGQRKVVQRRWHCAMQLVTTAQRVLS